MPRKLSQEENIAKAIEKHGDKYDYKDSTFNTVNNKTKI